MSGLSGVRCSRTVRDHCYLTQGVVRTIYPQIPQAAEVVVPTAPVLKDRLQLEHA